MSKRTSIDGGNTRVTSENSDFCSHGGTVDRDYTSSGKQISEVHNTPDGKSHEHEVSHGLFGNYAGKKK